MTIKNNYLVKFEDPHLSIVQTHDFYVSWIK
jgi:hypothetical protein